nr:hypothetical protein [Tanacetum cinerariifolium]
MTNAPAKQGGYKRNKPLCNSCKKHHTGNCTLTCNSYGNPSHYARDCKKKVVATGLNVAIGKSWGDMKKMMLEEFCPGKEVQRMEDELRSLKLKDTNIAAYTQRLGEMDRYLGGISMERRSETREHHKLKQSVSTLEDQMRGLMLEDKEENERLKKKLRASQQEKEQLEKAFRHVID